MSKISLSPNILGTGTLTIASPNTDTDRTLTLPDASGTVVSEAAGNLAYKQQNILGTVSQSGGVPTGAIIEQGTNANGTYIKYADGTMFCRREANLPGQALNTQSEVLATWPAAFSAAPNQQVTVKGQNGTGSAAMIGLVAYNGLYGGASATNAFATSYAYRVATQNSTDTVGLYFLGVGRWF